MAGNVCSGGVVERFILTAVPQNKKLISHGGNLPLASEKYAIQLDDWVDLSTGLNPNSYPVGKISSQVFSQLPYEQPALCENAAEYYGNINAMAVNGTQMAIQLLPRCLPEFELLAPQLGYQEHVKHWSKAGVGVHYYGADDLATAIHDIDRALKSNPQRHLLIINPNNPTGLKFSVAQITKWASTLAQDCYVIVDEAFMDVTPECSVLPLLTHNMIVLRSFGKFFGLAGIRVGFVFANSTIREALHQHTGLWSVNGPAQHIAIQALGDKEWQKKARIEIIENAKFSKALFTPLFEKINPKKSSYEMLFSSYWLSNEQGKSIVEHFAQNGILLRKIAIDEKHCLIRVGIVCRFNETVKERIATTINSYLKTNSFC